MRFLSEDNAFNRLFFKIYPENPFAPAEYNRHIGGFGLPAGALLLPAIRAEEQTGRGSCLGGVRAGRSGRSDKIFLVVCAGYIDFFATFASIGKIRT